jgi:ribosomal protein S18 acetylase RimI-like enzyme
MPSGNKEEPVAVRRATEDDCQGILACLARAFEPYATSYTPAAFEDTVLTRASLHSRLKQMSVFVAVNGIGEVVGTIAAALLSEHEGHLRGMAVLPEWQGRGLAKQLLTHAEFELRGLCNRITLDTTEPLHAAIGFYERNGFQRTGRITDFFGMPLFEFEKRLPQPPVR